MKRKMAIATVAAALCFGPQAFATGMYQPDGVTPIDPQGEAQQQQEQMMQMPPDPEGKAEELRLEGKCDQAIPILRKLAANDRDEIAQFNLGQCLIDLGKVQRDTQNASRLEREGAGWIIKTANRGLPNAQSSLVSIYLDGNGVPRDPVEAGKWSLLYHSNGTRLAIGMHDISPDLQARLDSALSNQNWNDAQSRASDWAPADMPSADE